MLIKHHKQREASFQDVKPGEVFIYAGSTCMKLLRKYDGINAVSLYTAEALFFAPDDQCKIVAYKMSVYL